MGTTVWTKRKTKKQISQTQALCKDCKCSSFKDCKEKARHENDLRFIHFLNTKSNTVHKILDVRAWNCF